MLEKIKRVFYAERIKLIEAKMRQYHKDLNVVDIPEFCKPKDERFETFVNERIALMIKHNKVDYFYRKALQA